jgi:hypothetical protein
VLRKHKAATPLDKPHHKQSGYTHVGPSSPLVDSSNTTSCSKANHCESCKWRSTQTRYIQGCCWATTHATCKPGIVSWQHLAGSAGHRMMQSSPQHAQRPALMPTHLSCAQELGVYSPNGAPSTNAYHNQQGGRRASSCSRQLLEAWRGTGNAGQRRVQLSCTLYFIKLQTQQGCSCRVNSATHTCLMHCLPALVTGQKASNALISHQSGTGWVPPSRHCRHMLRRRNRSH